MKNLLPPYSENLRDHKNGSYESLPKYRKMSLYPHAIKLLHHIEKCPGTPMLSNCSIILKNVPVPHAIKLLHNIEKCAISNKAINMHYRRSIEQHFCVLEPHRGCLHKVKKVRSYELIGEDQGSNKCAF